MNLNFEVSQKLFRTLLNNGFIILKLSILQLYVNIFRKKNSQHLTLVLYLKKR